MLVVGGLKLAFGGKDAGARRSRRRARDAPRRLADGRPTAPFTDRIEVLGVAKGRQSVTITSNTAELITAVHFTRRPERSRAARCWSN
jgi:membrane fusion protein (multidrug efflux system)